MHVYVQKSVRTTLPRSSSVVRGSELSQPAAPSKPGTWPSTESALGRAEQAHVPRPPSSRMAEDADQRSDLNAARTSSEKSSGSSQAAKWPPLSTSLK